MAVVLSRKLRSCEGGYGLVSLPFPGVFDNVFTWSF